MRLFIFYLLFFLVAKPIWANETLFTDNFERKNIGAWQVVRNSQHHHPLEPCFYHGLPALWQIVDGKLGININGIACTTEIIPQQLDLSEVHDYEFQFQWEFLKSTHMDRNVLIKWQDINNWYGLHILDNKLLVQKVIDGQLSSLYKNWGYYPFVADETYTFKITFIDDQIRVYINDELIIHTIDRAPFISGFKTLGFQASSGDIFQSSSFFDNLVITSIEERGEKKLHVHPYKQTDPEWKNQLYDHANDWSDKPTLGDWGCALSSAVMLLNYYQINQLPNNEKITPKTLNQWLKNQPDGFMGEGLVNWLAISRLTQEMSDILKTPVLEFSWIDKKKENIIQIIDHDQPVIINIPGHFLVADGYTADKLDFYIKDPAFDFQLLSQHQTELISGRVFTPSYTDLSYILLVHNPEMNISLVDESGHSPKNMSIYSEYISSQDRSEQAQVKVVQSIAKPEAGRYRLKITNSNQQESEFNLYTYDTLGKVSVFSLELQDGVVELNFDPNGETKIEKIDNKFTLLRDKLAQLYKDKEIKVKYAYLRIDLLASLAEKNLAEQTRYQNLIINQAKELKDFVPIKTIISNLADPD